MSASLAITSANEYQKKNTVPDSIWEQKSFPLSFDVSVPLLTFCVRTLQTQKDGMLTVLSGYDRLVTDSKVSWTYVTKSDSYRGGYPDPCDT